jgi:glycosyltransferase involved in cell wall biosynthesis
MPGRQSPAGSVGINGKFLAQPTTGVQRVARQLVLALDRRLATGTAGAVRWRLLVPEGAPVPALRAIEVQALPRPPGGLHAWEQGTLARAAGAQPLLCLAGSAPALARQPWPLLHDAAVFDHPEAYTRAFVAWYRFLFRRLARRAPRLFTVSAFSRARLAECLGVSPARFALLRPGADHLDGVVADAALLRQHSLHEKPYLLAVGSANPTKNLARLMQAWAQVPADARLVVCGGAAPRVFAETSHPDGDARVVRLGPVDDAALKALYAGAAGLVFPSTYEGYGIPPLEAMRCGCAVAASTAPAVREACGDATLAFDPASVPAIAAALRALLDDEALRARLRERGARHAAALRWDDTAAALLSQLRADGVPA